MKRRPLVSKERKKRKKNQRQVIRDYEKLELEKEEESREMERNEEEVVSPQKQVLKTIRRD